MKYIIVAFLAILAGSCNKQDDETTSMTFAEIQMLDRGKAENHNGMTDTATGTNIPSPPILKAGSPDWTKKIIKTANVKLELKDYDAFILLSTSHCKTSEPTLPANSNRKAKDKSRILS